MSGRFFSIPLFFVLGVSFLAIFNLLKNISLPDEKSKKIALVLFVLTVASFVDKLPITKTLDSILLPEKIFLHKYLAIKRQMGGVVNERMFYFQNFSVISPDGGKYINNIFHSYRANLSSKSREIALIYARLGIFGLVELDHDLYDEIGLSDPLLSRIQVIKIQDYFRIGHFQDRYPTGYITSLKTGKNYICSPRIRNFYDRILRLTRSEDLFNKERLVDAFILSFQRNPVLLDDASSLEYKECVKKNKKNGS